MVPSKGIETNPKKIAAMMNWPQPKNTTHIRSFLGFCNYYRHSLKDMLKWLSHYTSYLLGKCKEKTNEVEWTKQCEQAFSKLK